jgi:hypothetical protein
VSARDDDPMFSFGMQASAVSTSAGQAAMPPPLPPPAASQLGGLTGLDIAWLLRMDCEPVDPDTVCEKSIGNLERAGLIVPGAITAFALTERGKAYVDAIRALPLPIQRWVMP